MSEFQKWWDKPKGKNYDHPTFQIYDETEDFSRTAIFINEILEVSQAIYKDLGLRDESLLFAIYDRFIDRFNSMDTTDHYGPKIDYEVPESQLNIITTIENTETGDILQLRNELRYSHGQFNGIPEAKLYIHNSLNQESLSKIYKPIYSTR